MITPAKIACSDVFLYSPFRILTIFLLFSTIFKKLPRVEFHPSSPTVRSPILPNLHRIDDVLPQDVAARTNGGKGVEIGGREPDGKGGILLSQRLTGLLCVVEVMTDVAAHGKLYDTDDQSQQGDGRKQPDGDLGVDDVLHRRTRDNHQ